MRIPSRSALIGLVLTSSMSGAFVPSALAKDFYTRKRVNGHWVYGEFPKKGSQAEREQAAQETAPAPAAAPAPATPAPFTLGLHFAPQVQPAAPNTVQATDDAEAATTGSIRRRHARRQLSRSERRAESSTRAPRGKLRDAEARPEQGRTAEKPAVLARPAPDAPAAAVETRVASIPAGAEQPANPASDRAKHLADALAAKAAALASGVITSVRDPIPQPKAEPVSVNYDYKKGIKTVTYANGAIDEEPFDPATMKALATTPRTAAAR